MTKRPDDVGRPPAGGDADDGVTRPHLHRCQVCGALVRVILGTLHRGTQRPVATGDQSQHLVRMGVERGWALGRVQHSQPSRGPGTDVDDAATRGEPFGNGLDGRHDLGQRPLHRLGDAPVDVVHHVRQLSDVELIEVREALVDTLRGQVPGQFHRDLLGLGRQRRHLGWDEDPRPKLPW